MTAVLLASFLTFSREKADIDEKSIIKYVTQLSSDELEGRKSGTPSGYKAEKMIAKMYEELGLEPGGDDGNYYQEFTYPMMQFPSVGAVRMIDDGNRRDYTYGDDYYFYAVTSPGHVIAEVVFIGYGISRPDKGLDDYKGMDVEGKILLCLSGAPGNDKSEWGRDWTDYSKADLAVKNKALALLVFDPGLKNETLPRFRIWSFNLKYLKKGLIFSKVGKRIVDDIFRNTGKDLEELKREIDKKLKSSSFSTGKSLELKADTLIDTGRIASNIIGKIPGTHPQLKDEVVIISGHYDGGGTDPDGVIYNGANDNASGMAVLLEIARVMKSNHVRPSRSILFIGWGAEEQGAYGSQYFIENPVVLNEKIAATFVLDCVGLGDGEFWIFGAGHFADKFEEIKKNIDPILLEGFQPREEAGSDQYYFQQKEITSFFVHNIHKTPFGHTPYDDVTNLNPHALEKAARLIYHSALFAASKASKKTMQNTRF